MTINIHNNQLREREEEIQEIDKELWYNSIGAFIALFIMILAIGFIWLKG
jgi:hypothetical protein